MNPRNTRAADAAGAPPPDDRGTLKAVLVAHVPALVRRLGGDADDALGRAELTATDLAAADHRVDFVRVGRLFEAAVTVTGRSDFGILAAETFDARVGLGEFADLMLAAPTVGAALRSFVLFQHLNDSGAVPMLVPLGRSRMALAYSVYWHDVPAIDVVYDAGIGYGVQIMRMLCGPSWLPLRVNFPHRPPADRASYERLCGSTLRFDARAAAIELPTALLDRPNPGADAERYATLRTLLQRSLPQGGTAFTWQVRRALRPMVYAKSASAAGLAALFSMHERALRRRLSDEGTSVRGLLDEAHFEVAKQLLAHTRMSVAAIGAALDYANASAFTRAFRRWAGIAPANWRTRR